jgi:hypothetical protein
MSMIEPSESFAAKLPRGLLELGVLDRASDQLGGAGRPLVGVLRGKSPQAALPIANLDVKNVRVGDARVHDCRASSAARLSVTHQGLRLSP